MTQELSSAGPGNRGVHAGTLALLAVAALLLFVYWGLFADPDTLVAQDANLSATEEILFTPQGGSPGLVFAVAALLLYSRARALRAALTNPAWIFPGVCLVIAASLIGFWAHYVNAPDLMIPSLILMLLGSAALLGGRPAVAIIAAPSVFLIFALPIPAALVNVLIWPLQLATAQSADWILSLLGYQPETWGDIILARGKAFHVIESCSGMGMIHTMIMAGALYSILFYRSRTQVVLVMLAAPAIAYFVNALRVVSIVVNPYATWSSVHTTQGIVMIVVGVLLIAGFDWVLGHALSTGAPKKHPEKVPHPIGSTGWRAFSFVFAVLVALGMTNLFTSPWQPERYPVPRIIQLPNEIAEVPAKSIGKNKNFLGSIGFSNSSNREYVVEGVPVRVSVYSDERIDRRRSLLSPKNGFPGPGWTVEEEGRTELAPGGGEIDYKVLRSRQRNLLVYSWYEGVGSPQQEILRNAVGLDQSPFRRDQSVLALQISTPILDSREGLEEARLRLAETAQQLKGSS